MYGDNGVMWCDDALDAATGADALCLLTEWEEFVARRPRRAAIALSKPILIDGRNVFKEEDLAETNSSIIPSAALA